MRPPPEDPSRRTPRARDDTADSRDAAPDPGRRRAIRGLGGLGGLGALPWFGVVAAQGAPAHAVTIELAPDRPGRPTNARLLGTNTPWVYGSEQLMDDAGQWYPAMIARAREWSPPLLRYPGVPETHRWRQGVGPLAQRAPVFAYEGQPLQKIVYGTQEFLETCETLSAQPLIQVNVHDGDTAALARQAADWVAFLKARTLRSRVTGRELAAGHLWELGNEPYLMDSRRPDGKPNPLFLADADYARRVSQVLAAMRAVDPGLRAGLPFALDTLSGRPWHPDGEPSTVVGEHLGYAARVLSELARPQDIGFLSLHYYMPLVSTPSEVPDPAALPGDEALYWAAMAGTETLRGHLDAVQQFWQRHPATARLPVPPVIVTEYNSFFTTGHWHGQELRQNAYVMTLAGALFVADLVTMLATRPDVEAALQWSLNGDWVFGAIAPDAATARARPVFQVMLLLRRLLEAGGRLVPGAVDAAMTSRADRRVGFAAPVARLPLATVLAARHGSQLRVLTINKDPARQADVEIRLGAARATRASMDALAAPALFAAADTAAAATLSTPPVRIAADGRSASATLAPASVALWTIVLG